MLAFLPLKLPRSIFDVDDSGCSGTQLTYVVIPHDWLSRAFTTCFIAEFLICNFGGCIVSFFRVLSKPFALRTMFSVAKAGLPDYRTSLKKSARIT